MAELKISEHAHGHWPQIIGTLIGEQFANTRRNQACPSTGAKGKGTPRFRFSDQEGRGSYFCACSDGKGDGFDLLMCVRGYDFPAACRDVESVIGKCQEDGPMPQTERTMAERLRDRVTKTKASTYLASRGLEVAPGLDWAKNVPCFDEEKNLGLFAAMLAPITRGEKFLTYHVTYLQNGGKAPVPTPRKIWPGPANSGGSCQLYPAAEEMGIAEGVETAIAAKMIFGVPVWAALNTALLAAWEPPALVKRVTIFGDNDANYAGHAAAYQLAHKLVRKGVEVEIQIPPTVGTDWNDVLLANRTPAL